MACTRAFFADEGFCEADPPMLRPWACPDPHIDPVRALARADTPVQEPKELFLHTSPELALKRALSRGAEKIYSLGHVFRDGEAGRLHAAEFTLLEWYRPKEELAALVEDCRELFTRLSTSLFGRTAFPLPEGGLCDVSGAFAQATVARLWQRHAGVDLRAALARTASGEPDALVQAVRRAGYALRPDAAFDDAFHHVMLTRVEPAIGRDRPCAVTRWPARQAQLARLCPDDPLFAQRVEIYAGGVELANGFVELSDSAEQRRRFEADNRERAALGKPRLPLDEGFLADLPRMGPCVGMAVGFDRLLMLLAGKQRLSDVLPWSGT